MHGPGVVQSAVVSWDMRGGSRLETPRAVFLFGSHLKKRHSQEERERTESQSLDMDLGCANIFECVPNAVHNQDLAKPLGAKNLLRRCQMINQVKIVQAGGCIPQMWHSCYSPNGPEFNSRHSQNIILVLLRFIKGGGERKVDRGLKMLIEPNQYWLVESQLYKKLSRP